MGTTENVMRDLSLLIASGQDVIESDVRAYMYQAVNDVGEVEKWFSSKTSAVLYYVVNMETLEVIEMYEGKVRNHIGNLVEYSDIELTEAEAIRLECMNAPEYVNKDWLMEEHKAGVGHNIIRNASGQLVVKIGNCYVPYYPEGSTEAEHYFAALYRESSGAWELHEGSFSEPTPEAFTGELEVETPDGNVYLWRNYRWTNEETGKTNEFPIYTPPDGDEYVQAPSGIDLRTNQPFIYSGYLYHRRSDKWYKFVPEEELGEYNTGITVNTDKGDIHIAVASDTAKPDTGTGETGTGTVIPGTGTGGTGGTSTGGDVGGRPGEGGGTPVPGIGVSAGASVLADFLGKTHVYPPAILQDQFTAMGWQNGVNAKDMVSMAIMSLISVFVRISNEPIDRALRFHMNEIAPNTLPGANDLVRMELREVFRAADRAAALSVPPSERFTAEMAKWGFDKYWSDSYWAAHWELPSPLMGYDMFHRLRPGKVDDSIAFDRDALWNLLKVLDYRPDFIDRLIELSYHPITRVDVRRMWKLGVIKTREELVGKYLDLGYSPDDAENMTEFTIRENEPGDKTPSKSFFESEFKEGRLAYAELVKAYQMLGYAETYARWMADALLISMQKKEVQERERRETGGRTDKMLSPEKALKAFSLGIIDEETARHKIIRYGYDKIDTEIMLEIEKAGMKAE